MKRPLLRTTTFVKAARRLVRKKPGNAADLRETLQILSENAFHPLLRTHKLKGKLAGTYACSAGFDLRIIFELVTHQGEEAILLLTVGTHEEVY